MTALRLGLLLIVSCVPAGAAIAVSESDIRQAQGVATTCELSGWSTNREGQGLLVRDEPGPAARVIGVIPFDLGTLGEDYAGFGISFQITASRNGWVRIRGAADEFGRPAFETKPIFGGDGWVHGSFVNFAVQSSRVRAVQQRAASVVAEVRSPLGDGRDTEWLTNMARITAVLACDGRWAMVRYRGKTSFADEVIPPDRVQPDGAGWVTGICGRQETTCDMRTDD